MEENNKRKKISLTTYILTLIIIILIIICIILSCNVAKNSKGKTTNPEQLAESNKVFPINNTDNEVMENNTVKNESKNGIVSNFDLSFLKLENQEANKVYSPLSIKYALKMLEQGTSGESKAQITNVVGDISLAKYNPHRNMALANALFVNTIYQNNIKQTYITELETKYNAAVIADSFENTQNINSWISNNTLQLINNGIDNISSDTTFLLVNALGIDMEWKQKFFDGEAMCSYDHENFSWSQNKEFPIYESTFDGLEKTISGMQITASLNNYDIINELGEDNIRRIVGDEFKKWAKELTEEDYEYKKIFQGDLSDSNIEKKLSEYLDGGNYTNDGYVNKRLYCRNSFKLWSSKLFNRIFYICR